MSNSKHRNYHHHSSSSGTTDSSKSGGTTTFIFGSTSKKKQQPNFVDLYSETKKTANALNQFYSQLDAVLNEKEQSLNQMTESMKKYDFKDGSIIKLNVGGKLFSVLKETLCTRIKRDNANKLYKKEEYYPEHMLNAMISGLFELLKDENECIFIDRDGTYFSYILNYLRAEGLRGKFVLPSKNDECALKALYIEAQYYQIEGLMEELELIIPPLKVFCESEKYFPNTNILNYNQIFQINHHWFGNLKQEWKLLWQGTRDGFDANTFHTKCDDKGPTITIIKTGCGSIFGGYTSVNWNNNSNSYQTDSNAFLFSLHLPGRSIPYKFPISSTGNAIFCNASYGPTFGGGQDLTVTDRVVKCSASSYSYHSAASVNSNYFFSSNNVEEIEVYYNTIVKK
ncbi:hypothetical protein ABK040_011235 [Willaertia magna]